MSQWPPVPYAVVKARLASVKDDGPDDDFHPDWTPDVGTKVTLRPSITGVLVYGGSTPDPIIIRLQTVTAEVGAGGYLLTPTGHPVHIAATDDPLMSVTGWTWTASFHGIHITFSASSGTEVQLADFVLAPAVDTTRAWVERIPDLIDATGSLVSIESIRAEGADLVIRLTSGVDHRVPFPPQEEGGYIPDLSNYVVTTDPRLSDAREPLGHVHSVEDIQDFPDLSGYATIDDPRFIDAREPSPHTHTVGDITDFPDIPEVPDLTGFVAITDPRLEDDRNPTPHSHTVSDISDFPAIPDTNNLVSTDDSRLSDARDPNPHRHSAEDIDGLPDIPEMPDLSLYVTDNDPRLTDYRNPTPHTHTVEDISDFPDVSGFVDNTDPRLTDDRNPTQHSHTVADISDFPDIPEIPDLSGLATTQQLAAAISAIPDPSWAEVTDKPSTFPPAAHGHDASEITDLSAVAVPQLLSGDPGRFRGIYETQPASIPNAQVGDWIIVLDNLPAYIDTAVRRNSNGSWPSRPDVGTDTTVMWLDLTNLAPDDPAGFLTGVDVIIDAGVA